MNKILFLSLFTLSSFFSYSQCWSKVSTGGAHTLGIGADNSLWSWGRSQAGQLGLGDLSSKNIPTKVGSDLNWSKISSGNAHSLALKLDGTLWVWGRNTTGQLGNPAIGQNLLVPTQLGTDNDWIFISAGDEYSLAIKNNGTLWAWGENVYGQLGDNTFGTGNYLSTPTQIGTDTNWSYVSAGTTHTLAIKTDGTLWGFGQNNFGKLGDGSIIDKVVPTQIGTASDWQTVEAAIKHSIALKTNGSLWTWGDNTDGQLGNGLSGAAAAQSAPINIEAGNTFQKITRGQKHTLVKRSNGTLWSWGGNVTAQLGDNTFVPKPNPTAVSSVIDTWDFVSSRVSHCAGLKSDGSLYTWGSNLYGQLGDASQTTRKIPTLIACPVLANNQFNLTNGFSIYPNPTSSLLNVEMVDGLELSKIQIVDLTGKIVLEQNQNLNILNVENLANGLYIIQMYSENKSFTGKFVKN
jgi:Secretion system C-terminal sorting domain/Regulator of chromosome condensation (RCC1) repeat